MRHLDIVVIRSRVDVVLWTSPPSPSRDTMSHPFLFMDTVTSHTAAGGAVLVSGFEEQTWEPGSSVSLKCSASGHPLPQVTWTLDGQSVPDDSRFRSGDFVTRDSLVVSFVNISSAAVQDGGLYVSPCLSFFVSLSFGMCAVVTTYPLVCPLPQCSSFTNNGSIFPRELKRESLLCLLRHFS